MLVKLNATVFPFSKNNTRNNRTKDTFHVTTLESLVTKASSHVLTTSNRKALDLLERSPL